MKKVCPTCNIEKRYKDFYKSSITKDGLFYNCKECKKAYQRNYRQLNLDLVRTRDKISSSKYYKQNKEAIAEYWKKDNLSNRKKRNDRLKSWRTRNPDKSKNQTQKRRFLKENQLGHFEPWYWEVICYLAKDLCLVCKKKGSLTMDHIKPLSKGGLHDVQNIQPLCQSCNSQKGTKEIDYRQNNTAVYQFIAQKRQPRVITYE